MRVEWIKRSSITYELFILVSLLFLIIYTILITSTCSLLDIISHKSLKQFNFLTPDDIEGVHNIIETKSECNICVLHSLYTKPWLPRTMDKYRVDKSRDIHLRLNPYIHQIPLTQCCYLLDTEPRYLVLRYPNTLDFLDIILLVAVRGTPLWQVVQHHFLQRLQLSQGLGQAAQKFAIPEFQLWKALGHQIHKCEKITNPVVFNPYEQLRKVGFAWAYNRDNLNEWRYIYI